MHPKVAQALEEIDAAIFSGDTFDDLDSALELFNRMLRWQRELTDKLATALKDRDETS